MRSNSIAMPNKRTVLRAGFAISLALLTAGCFQPLYGDPKVVPTAGLGDKLNTVEVAAINQPNGSRLARVGVELRDALLFDLTHGGPDSGAKRYRLNIQLTASSQQVIVDITSARPDIQTYGVDAVYTLTEIETKKPMFVSTTFARVSYDIPGQQQRFAGERGLRDAENRAARVIAENIRQRLASFLVAGT
jgi:LPS-assembly lipoprotein